MYKLDTRNFGCWLRYIDLWQSKPPVSVLFLTVKQSLDKFFFLGFDGRRFLFSKQNLNKKAGWWTERLCKRVIFLTMQDLIWSWSTSLKCLNFTVFRYKLLMLILLIRASRVCTISSIYVEITNGGRESVSNRKFPVCPLSRLFLNLE